MIKFVKTHIVNALTVALMIAVTACSNSTPLTPEEQVTALMAEMEIALEERNLSAMFEHVSDNYEDHRGNDKKALRKIAQAYTLRNKGISIVSSLNSINALDDSTVAVEASILLGARANNGGNLLPQLSADSQRVSAVFGLEEDAWKLISMSWKGHGGHY